MAYPPELPPTTRTDTTVAASDHADDHNKLAQAITDLVDALGPDPSGDDYATLTERLAALETLVGGSPLAHPGKILAEAVGVATAAPITSAVLVDVAAAGAVTFTVPLSGAVWVELEGDTRLTNTALAAANSAMWGLREGASIVAAASAVLDTEHLADVGGATDRVPFTNIAKRFRVTALTPGSSLTWKWAASVEGSAGAVQITSGTMRVVEALGT